MSDKNINDYPTDGKLRPVSYDESVDKLVDNVCKSIRVKHFKFMEDANISYDDFKLECSARVWKGLSTQFTGASSVKSYVYIICYNHWRNVVTKFFNQAESFEKNRSYLVTTEYSKLFEYETHEFQSEPINMLNAHPEYEEEVDYDYDTLVMRKLVWFTYRNYRKNKKMARALILCHSGRPMSRVASEIGISVKRLTKEFNKTKEMLGKEIIFDDESFSFKLVKVG